MEHAQDNARVTGRLEKYRNRLLDTGRRNRMIHYRQTRRATLTIEEPGMTALFNALTLGQKELSFQRPLDRQTDFRAWSMLKLMETMGVQIPVRIGDLRTPVSFGDQQAALSNMRARARLAMDEQGANILYLSCGFLEWREKDGASSPWLSSPILMVPVTLSIASLNAPYMLRHNDDEIEVNPTLQYKFENELGLTLPPFELTDEGSIDRYMEKIEQLADERGWRLHRTASLGLVQFQKITMYHDLAQRGEKLAAHPVVRAICGDRQALPPAAAPGDMKPDSVLPGECFQVVDADSSQQAAIMLSREGASFVLLGPPGTGKSQTITNIIAEALADGKKVLFVSEKAAALQVVLKRLAESRLDDFCLSLHDYRANKRDILAQIGKNLELGRTRMKDGVMEQLAELVDLRGELNAYADELHEAVAPLGMSVYEALGRMAGLQGRGAIVFDVEDVLGVSRARLGVMQYNARRLEKAAEALGCPPRQTPWYGAKANVVTGQWQRETREAVGDLAGKLAEILRVLLPDGEGDGLPWKALEGLPEAFAALDTLPLFPAEWLDEDGAQTQKLAEAVRDLRRKRSELEARIAHVREEFGEALQDLDIPALKKDLTEGAAQLRQREVWAGMDDARLVAASPETARQAGEAAAWLEGAERAGLDAVRELGRMGLRAMPTNSRMTLDDMAALCGDADVLARIDRAIRPEWLEAGARAQMIARCSAAATHEQALDAARADLGREWKPEAEGLDAAQVREQVVRPLRRLLAGKPEDDDALAAVAAQQKAYDLLAAQLREAADAVREGAALLGAEPMTTVAGYETLGMALRLTAELDESSRGWMSAEGAQAALRLAEEARKMGQALRAGEATLEKDWDAGLADEDVEGMLGRFKTRYVRLLDRLFGGDYRRDMERIRSHARGLRVNLSDHEAVAALERALDVRRGRKWFADHRTELERTLGRGCTGPNTDWDRVNERVRRMRTRLNRIEDMEGGRELLRLCAEAHALGKGPEAARIAQPLTHARLDAIRQSVAVLVPEVAGKVEEASAAAVLLPALERLAEERGALAQELTAIAALRRAGEGLSVAQTGLLADGLERIAGERAWFDDNADRLPAVEPGAGWQALLGTLQALDALCARYPGNVLPAAAAKRLCDPEAAKGWLTALRGLELLETGRLAHGRALVAALLPEVGRRSDLSVQWMMNALTKTAQAARRVAGVQAALSAHAKRDGWQADPAAALERLDHARNEYGAWREECSGAAECLAPFAREREIDWDAADECLSEVLRFVRAGGAAKIPPEMAAAVAGDARARTALRAALSQVRPLMQAARPQLTAFTALFGNGAQMLAEEPIGALARRVEACMADFGLLDRWIVYRDARTACGENGLGDFAQRAEEALCPAQGLADAFEYGFFRCWCQAAMQTHPRVEKLRRHVQDDRVERFRRLDAGQLHIARERIRQRIIDKYPDVNRPAVPGDELSVLRHELNKRARQMPLRKLFRAIPNLLLTLKPCLMMSPLSVAHFLEADSYQFDLVVFDEASQIFPQDALGSIMRGRQVIIAGDTRQLPPTNFFSAATGGADDDFDTDDDGFETEIGDSILEEAAGVMPSSMLMWHYRSRSEQLIAFANRQMYGGRLVTFPSTGDRARNFGVEFIHVPDGLYEPKPSNCNRREAARCVELIAEHIRTTPGRSLGVIAFSEKQQSAIREAVEAYRLDHPEHESFFDENREDAFFVKNLENVQGDERDTILFSVGYGYTKEQRERGRAMHMQFGPLGRAGGERRLNVAITRARMNVKLVSSILPADIDPDRVNSEGVRMLRSYMEYAIRGPEALPARGEEEVRDEAAGVVAAFLREKGYTVREQLGCSGYRIDIAVADRERPDTYLAAVECDGYAWRAAATARDRDRLRPGVLEGMGWKVYRVWAMEWLRNPELEGGKLLAFLEAAQAERDRLPEPVIPENAAPAPEDIAEPIGEAPVTLPQPVAPGGEGEAPGTRPAPVSPYGFVPYVTAVPEEAPGLGMPGLTREHEKLVHIIAVEQPVHSSTLYARMAADRGIKVSVRLRSVVDQMLWEVRELVEHDGEFYSLRGDEKHLAVRMHVPGADTRPVNLVPDSEIRLAMETVAGKTFGLTREGLLNETARSMGYGRRGANVDAALGAALEYLTSADRLTFVDGKVQVKEARTDA